MHVRIGGIKYEVIITGEIKDEDNNSLLGQIDFAACTIKLDRELSAQARWQVLWHELIHGILTQAGHHDKVKDELIDALAYGIVGILYDNPDLGMKQ